MVNWFWRSSWENTISSAIFIKTNWTRVASGDPTKQSLQRRGMSSSLLLLVSWSDFSQNQSQWVRFSTISLLLNKLLVWCNMSNTSFNLTRKKLSTPSWKAPAFLKTWIDKTASLLGLSRIRRILTRDSMNYSRECVRLKSIALKDSLWSFNTKFWVLVWKKLWWVLPIIMGQFQKKQRLNPILDSQRILSTTRRIWKE